FADERGSTGVDVEEQRGLKSHIEVYDTAGKADGVEQHVAAKAYQDSYERLLEDERDERVRFERNGRLLFAEGRSHEQREQPREREADHHRHCRITEKRAGGHQRRHPCEKQKSDNELLL